MRELTEQEMLEYFSDDGKKLVKKVLENPNTSGIVVFQNQVLDSSHLGDVSGLIFGPGCTYKSWEEMEDKWLGDLPSERKYPVGYYHKEGKCLG